MYSKVGYRRKYLGAIRVLVNSKSLLLECARGLHERLLMSVMHEIILLYRLYS